MAAKTSAAKKKAGSGGRSAKKTTSGVKAVHSTKPSSRTTSKTTAHKKNGSGSTSKASRTGTNTYRRRTIEEMNEYQDHIAFEQGMTILLNCAVLVLCYVSFFGLAGQFGAVWLDGMDDSDGNRSCCYFFDRKSGRQTRTAQNCQWYGNRVGVNGIDGQWYCWQIHRLRSIPCTG